MTDQNEEAYRLAYDEAIRALTRQQSALDEFRTRAGILLSGAANSYDRNANRQTMAWVIDIATRT